MAHSSRKSRRRKPNKPNPDFPLYTHAAGRWAKKVLGRTCYFTKWSDDLKGKATLEQIDREPTVSGGALSKRSIRSIDRRSDIPPTELIGL